MFLKRVGAAFHEFIDETERTVRNKCKEDLVSTTRYITWSLHTKNGFGLRSMLGKARSGLAGRAGAGGAGWCRFESLAGQTSAVRAM